MRSNGRRRVDLGGPAPTANVRALVITDLDGSLLDHDSYDWSPARPALLELRRRNIPVIFNTSKTLQESRQLQAEVGLTGPLIVENGSCVHLDADQQIVLGRPRKELQQALAELRWALGFKARSFAELGRAGIIEQTGLPADRAALAAARAWSEPLLWEDDDEALQAFRAAARSRGLNLLVGGRFVHLLGDCDKGRAAQALVAARGQGGARPTVIALGDRPNDAEMLRMADYPVWVRSPKGPPADWQTIGRAPRLTDATGPAGWNAAILEILDHELSDRSPQP